MSLFGGKYQQTLLLILNITTSGEPSQSLDRPSPSTEECMYIDYPYSVL